MNNLQGSYMSLKCLKFTTAFSSVFFFVFLLKCLNFSFLQTHYFIGFPKGSLDSIISYAKVLK